MGELADKGLVVGIQVGHTNNAIWLMCWRAEVGYGCGRVGVKLQSNYLIASHHPQFLSGLLARQAEPLRQPCGFPGCRAGTLRKFQGIEDQSAEDTVFELFVATWINNLFHVQRYFHNSTETPIGGEGQCLDGFSSGRSSQMRLLLQAGDDCTVVSEKSTQIATPGSTAKEQSQPLRRWCPEICHGVLRSRTGYVK